MMSNIFSCVYLPSVYFFQWDICLLRCLPHFLIRLFYYCGILRGLCICWIAVAYQMYLFANIFFQYVASLILLYCLSQNRHFNFSKAQFINYFFHGSWIFLSWIFCVASKKALPFPGLSRFSFLSSSRSFAICVSYLDSDPFYFNFQEECRSVSRHFSLFVHGWMPSCSSTICWRDCLCSIVSPLLLCQIPDCISVGLFLSSHFCSIDLFVYSFSNTTLSHFLITVTF